MIGRMGKIRAVGISVACALALAIGAGASAFAADTVTVKVSDLSGANERQVSITVSDNNNAASDLQQAFDLAKDGKSKITITMPGSTYLIDGKLRIYSNTTLDMTAGTTIKRADSGVNDGIIYNYPENWRYDTLTRDSVGGYDMSKNITIKGGTLDGGNISKATDTSDLLRIDHAQNVTVQNVTLKNVYDCHHLEFVGVKDGVIDGCKFSGFRYQKGHDKDVAYGREAVQIEAAWKNNDKELWAKDSKIDGTSCDNVVVSGCTFTDLPSAVGQHHYTSNGKARGNNIKIINNVIAADPAHTYFKTAITAGGMNNLIISGNKVTGHYQFAIHAYRGNNITLENNSIDGCGMNAIMINNLALDVTCTGNVITNNKKHAISVGDAGTMVNTISGNAISKTTASDSSGICVAKGSVNLISENVITNAKKSGITITGGTVGIKNNTEVGIVGNTITKAKTFNGISVSGSSTKVYNIANNKIDNVKKSGISVTAGTVGTSGKTNVGIVGNKITKAGANGITISGKKAKVFGISGNSITKITKGNGISVTSNAKVYIISKNTIKAVKNYKGIWLGGNKSVKVKVNKNKITAAVKKRCITTGPGVKYKASGNKLIGK